MFSNLFQAIQIYKKYLQSIFDSYKIIFEHRRKHVRDLFDNMKTSLGVNLVGIMRPFTPRQ